MTAPLAAATEALIAAERRRAQAVMSRNVAVLGDLLHDDLIYIHATGVRHDRAQLLAFVASGPHFVAVELGDLVCRVEGDIGLVTGMLRMSLLRAGETDAMHLSSFASEVWLRESAPDGARWLLLRFQSTRPT